VVGQEIKASVGSGPPYVFVYLLTGCMCPRIGVK
jgi:hypothetical protein